MSRDRKGTSRKPVPPLAWPKCPTGKAGYLSRGDASKVAKWQREQIGAEAKRLRAYRCTTCSNFHIGNQPEALVRGHVTRADMHHNHRLANGGIA